MIRIAAGGLASVRHILCIGAHADDIEIGCGGTILQLLASGGDVTVDWVVLSADGARATEARLSAHLFLDGALMRKVRIENFDNRFFPSQRRQIKEAFDQLVLELSPDIIFTHYGEDHHQDHRLVSELTWNTFRDHLILEYEIPKYDGDLDHPNTFVTLDRARCEQKVAYLCDAFVSQREKHWFSSDTFMAILRLRGIECRAPGGFAEAFHCRKLVLA